MLALPNGLEMVDTLSSSDARQNFQLFAVPVFGNDNCNGTTNRLLGSVAEDTLGPFIPACDDAIEVLAYNRVVAGLDDGGQPAQSLFSFAKGAFDLLAFGDVAINLKHRAVSKQLHPAVHTDFVTILTYVTQFTEPVA